MTNATSPGSCPQCGASANGKFCPDCGAPQGPRSCPSCGTEVAGTSRFCHRCGAAVAATPAQGRSPGASAAAQRGPWLVALGIIVVAVFAIIYKVLGPDSPAPAGGGVAATPAAAGAAPDISQMSPMERFIRLNDRIMTAVEAGDTATVQSFLPMALSAYAQLPAGDIDTDARYHAALLQAQGGNLAAARAINDSILGSNPANLIGLALRGALAEMEQDAAALRDARQRFLANWDAEIAKSNAEYLEHRNVLDAFKVAAER